MYDWKDYLLMSLITGIVATLVERKIVSRDTVLFYCGLFVCWLLGSVVWYVNTHMPDRSPVAGHAAPIPR